MKRKKNIGGRPTKYSEQRIEQILGLLRLGNYKSTSCRAVGIDPDTLRNWEKSHPGLTERLEGAEGMAEASIVAEVRRSLPQQPHLGLGLLARRWPSRWSERAGGEEVIRMHWAVQNGRPTLVVERGSAAQLPSGEAVDAEAHEIDVDHELPRQEAPEPVQLEATPESQPAELPKPRVRSEDDWLGI
jgi:hypothetical protein